MALIKINGVDIPTPTELEIGLFTLSKAERNANGRMIIEKIADKKKLFLTYAFLTESDAAFLLDKVSLTFYDVTFMNPKTNKFESGSFYSGDRSIGMVDYQDGVARYRDFTVNLIER